MPQVVTEDLGSRDVLVVGGGIAGVSAALSAAEQGAHVSLACAGALFGGSSFFPGTWGLGLVGPDGEADIDELVGTICSVGRGMADAELARVLVSGVEGSAGWLERHGCRLRRAENADEREFIPCFDHKRRLWRGLERESFRGAMGAALERAGVEVLPGLELLGLERRGGGWRAAFFSARGGRAACAQAGGVVLATGGFGGLYGRTLTMPDVLGTAQAIALGQGAGLINCEFIQIMCGLVRPVEGVVFNEKAFRYSRIEGLGRPELLEARSGHGPFSASGADRAVDLAIARLGSGGASCRLDLPDPLPEFMRTYSDWLRGARGIAEDAELRLAHYAHASNGGILIDARAAVGGCPGLFACGECTGGMHGADRVGGLASANALVFGRIAGREAAWSSGERGQGAHGGGAGMAGAPLHAVASPQAASVLKGLKQAMDARCLVERSEEGLRRAAESIASSRDSLESSSAPSEDAAGVARTRRAELALLSAEAMVTAMLARRESRGAHYRADFPEEDPAQARPLVVAYKEGRLVAAPRS